MHKCKALFGVRKMQGEKQLEGKKEVNDFSYS